MAQKSITERLEAFKVTEADRVAKATQRTRQMAHRMIQRMANGEPFGLDEFMFAATMGRIDDHTKEATTLKKASELPQGTIVGIAEGKRLQAIGLTQQNPLHMEVQLGDGISEQLNAKLRLVAAVERVGSYEYPRCRQASEGSLTIDVLRRWGRPEEWRSPENVFYNPRDLVIGASALVDFVGEAHDPLNATMLATHYERIAETIIYPTQE